MKPGVHDISLEAYLRDPAPEPSLSAGIANTLLYRSPMHAWHKYNEERQEYRRDAALGTVFHAVFLGKGGEYEVIDCSDFRTKAAKEARDEALEAGKTPIKASDFEAVEEMVAAAERQLEAHDIGDFRERGGAAEQTLIWHEENGVWCRACVDWLPDDLETEGAIYNLKTSTCAHADVWVRAAYAGGYDLSAAHYMRGVERTLGFEVNERFVVVESKPPYALNVIDLSPASVHMAERKRQAAVALWGECLARGSWPGYPARICTIEAPPYHEAAWTDAELAGRYEPAMLDQLIDGFAA